jgi:mannose-1-phosphate guanylyltransferase
MSGAGRVHVAAGYAHRESVLDALPGLDASRFIGEPFPRDTAPCIGLAALRLMRVDPESVMVVSPADHVYTNPDAPTRALEIEVAASREDSSFAPGDRIRLYRAGGIGRRRSGSPAAARQTVRGEARRCRGERVPRRRAAPLEQRGLHLEDARHPARPRGLAPEIWACLRQIGPALGGHDEERVVREAFAQVPSISIDYAVMERAPNVLVVPADPGWSDVGSWDAVAELYDTDASGNGASTPAAEVLHLNTTNTFVYSETSRLIATIGTAELLVVDAGDALLICRRGDSQAVRALVDALKARGRTDLI